MDETPSDKQPAAPPAFWNMLVVAIASFAVVFFVIITHPRGVPVEFYNYPVKTVLLISAGMVGIVACAYAYAIWVSWWRAKRR